MPGGRITSDGFLGNLIGTASYAAEVHWDNISNKPPVPGYTLTVGSGSVTIKTALKSGTFNVNQEGDTEIDLGSTTIIDSIIISFTDTADVCTPSMTPEEIKEVVMKYQSDPGIPVRFVVNGSTFYYPTDTKIETKYISGSTYQQITFRGLTTQEAVTKTYVVQLDEMGVATITVERTAVATEEDIINIFK